ncbi:MAG: hypothetical protein HRU75_09665 [Planctomycetia bacterium]|nr:MAG: hypothetical protein HRU75_09665 [Planctomycetia bacterium]
MAVSTPAAATRAGQRRFVYGLNVTVAIVAATALAGLLIYLGDRFDLRRDMTRSGASSVSPRTASVLRSLDQDVTITGLYTVLSKYQQFAQKRKDTVRDMLKLFEVSGRRVTTRMLDPLEERKGLEDLLARIREKPAYRDESAPHKSAIDRASPLLEELLTLAREESEKLRKLAAENEALTRNRDYVIITNSFTLLLAPTCEDLAIRVRELTTGDIPRYGRAVDALRGSLPQVREALEQSRSWFSRIGQSMQDISAEVRDAFRLTADLYALRIESIDSILRDIEPLKPVKLDAIADALANAVNSPPILVETAAEARVVSFEEAWSYRQEPAGQDQDDRVFNGEEALLAAVLGLTSKERLGVVFVRYGGESPIRPDFARFQPGQPPPTAPYIQLSQALEKLNFLPTEWDLATSKTPPVQEGVTGTVYIVLPPAPPPPQNPMRPQPPPPSITPDDKQKLYEAIAASKGALFLVESTTQRGPGEPYAFAEYLRTTWGIDPRSSSLVLELAPIPSKEGLWAPVSREPLLQGGALNFGDHPIGKPLRSSPLALFNTAPLARFTDDGAPQNVTVETVLSSSGDGVWAIADWFAAVEEFRRIQGLRPGDNTQRSPMPLVMSARNDKGVRVVVCGSTDFARDDIAQFRQLAASADGTLRRVQMFPGNTDLVTNALFWVAGDEGRIAIGTRQDDVPRLSRLEPGATANFWKVFLVAIWPATVLVVGGIVALVRRR